MNKNFVKRIDVVLVVLLIAITAVFALGACDKENEWIPQVQGSYVVELAYEEIADSYSIEKYCDYAAFSKSNLADYNFISQKTAKEERYSSVFFETRDLIAIKFNNAEKNIDFTVANVKFDSNLCTVSLLPVKRVAKITEQPTTYGCFVETQTDISEFKVEVVMLDAIVHESQQFSYITDNNEYYLFEDQPNPVVFKIDSKAGILAFFQNDGVLSEQSYVYLNLNMYGEEVFEQYALMLIRLPSSDFENCVATATNDAVKITIIRSNHYLYSNETKHSKLIALLVPKDLKLDSITQEIYFEFEDDLSTHYVKHEYVVSETTALGDLLVKYTLSER